MDYVDCSNGFAIWQNSNMKNTFTMEYENSAVLILIKYFVLKNVSHFVYV